MSGSPEHVPTEKLKQLVSELYSAGITQARIADRLNIDDKTLRKHYREQLDNTKENMAAALAKNLYQDAMNGDKQAREFWLKCQANWSYAKPPEDDKKSTTDTLLEKLIEKL